MAYYHLFWNKKQSKPELIKVGFNFYAFFFDVFYFIYKKAWISALAFFMGSIFISAISILIPNPTLTLLLSLAFKIYIGFDASDCLWGEYHRKKFKYLKSDFYETDHLAEADSFKLANNSNSSLQID